MIPYPKLLLGMVPPFGRLVLMIRCTTWYQGMDGYRERISATAPDTNAAEALVPSR